MHKARLKGRINCLGTTRRPLGSPAWLLFKLPAGRSEDQVKKQQLEPLCYVWKGSTTSQGCGWKAAAWRLCPWPRLHHLTLHPSISPGRAWQHSLLCLGLMDGEVLIQISTLSCADQVGGDTTVISGDQNAWVLVSSAHRTLLEGLPSSTAQWYPKHTLSTHTHKATNKTGSLKS